MLLGEYEHTIDDKNRLTLPAKFRSGVLRTGSSSRAAWTAASTCTRRTRWERRRPELDSPRSTRSARKARRMQRYFFSGADRGRARQAGARDDPGRAPRARRAGARGRRRRRQRPRSRSGTARPGAASSRRSKGVRRMLPNVLQRSATDHVPVLADEVRRAPRRPARARRSSTAPSAPAATPRCSPRDLEGRGKLIAIDRDPTVRPYFERFAAALPGLQTRLLRGDFSVVLAPARRQRRRAPTRSCSTSASRRCRSTVPSAASRTRPTRRSTCAWIRPPSSRPRELVNEAERARARDDLPALRRGALRAADRARDRAAPRASGRSSAPASSSRRSRRRSPRRRASATGIPPSASSRRCGSP